MGELRNVCLHTLDSHDVPLILSTLTRISDIKNIIHTTAGIPTNAIRLLYKGKLVKDPQTLEGLGVRENDSFFLVANIDIQDGSLTALANMTVVNSTSRLRRSRDRRRELRVAQISEALRQTIYSLDDLSSETHRNGYQLTTRILREGQWVDALDTVDQWLDAQIMQLRTTRSGTRALVHYIGWPERWDEWIKADSERIMPFRSKTTQILGSVLQSPIPSLIPFFRTPGLETVSEIVLKSSSYFDNITRFLDRSRQLVVFLNASDQIGHYLGSQMSERSDEEEAQIELDVLVQHTAPVLDRLGRLLTDLSLVISKNNNIEASLIETSEDLHINRFVIENTE